MKEQQRKKDLLWIIILASVAVFVEFRYADLSVAIMLLIVDAIAIGILYVYRIGNGHTKAKPLQHSLPHKSPHSIAALSAKEK
jgi:hypothetical protein